jgi:putative molybdopterin biosynthesis protein
VCRLAPDRALSSRGGKRSEGLGAQEAVYSALADPGCIMVIRHQSLGIRILIDPLLGEPRWDGYRNRPHSHNAVGAVAA